MLNEHVTSVFGIGKVMGATEFREEDSDVLKRVDITKQTLGGLETHKGGYVPWNKPNLSYGIVRRSK